jgi:hypothetical protein
MVRVLNIQNWQPNAAISIKNGKIFNGKSKTILPIVGHMKEWKGRDTTIKQPSINNCVIFKA